MAFQRRNRLVVIEAVNERTRDAVPRQLGDTPPAWGAPGNPQASAPAPAPKRPAPQSPTPPPSARAVGPMVLGYYTQYTPSSQTSQQSLAAHATPWHRSGTRG